MKSAYQKVVEEDKEKAKKALNRAFSERREVFERLGEEDGEKEK